MNLNKLIDRQIIISIFSFLVVIMICSCNPKREVVEFPEKVSLKAQVVKEIPEVIAKGNINMVVVDTFLIVQQGNVYFFNIYSTKSHKLLSQIGSKGKGPGEFVRPSLLDQRCNSSEFLVYDLDRKMISKINIPDLLSEKQDYNKHVGIPRLNNNYLLYFFHNDDDILIATPEDYKSRFVIYDYKKNSSVNVPYIPEHNYSISKSMNTFVYRSTVAVNRDKGIIATAPILLAQLDFFDLKGNFIKSVYFDKEVDLEKNLRNGLSKNTVEYIVEIEKYDDKIFALNNANSVNDFLYTKNISPFKLQVYSWDGVPVKEYTLDKRNISSFAIDKLHNRVYAYSVWDSRIVVYDLE